jgi:hypothetical protein
VVGGLVAACGEQPGEVGDDRRLAATAHRQIADADDRRADQIRLLR